MRRCQSRLPAMLLLAAGLFVSTGPASGQSSDSTGDNSGSPLQMLQNLTPEQRDAISGQLGGGTGGQIGSTGGSNGRALEQQQSEIEQQRMRRLRNEDEAEQPEPLIPVLKAEDWVVVSVETYPEPQQLGPNGQPQTPLNQVPNPQSGQNTQNLQNLQALQAAQNGQNATGVSQTPGMAGGAASANLPLSPNANGQAGNPPPPLTVPELTDDDKKQRDHLIELLQSKNPYQLTRDGMLNLPGFAPIPLAGLTEQLATLRVGVEPALRYLWVRVTRLPLKKYGADALKPFGYDLFDQPSSMLAPAVNVPVPADYVIGADDELDVQIYGTQNRSVRLVVGRDGRVNLPELGPISVAGQTFDSAKASIESRIERRMIGAHASVSMGATRFIRVFVLGEAKQPGSYVISGLGTITSALFAAGGVQRVGSLRNIQLKRQGVLVRQLDLYDMLIRGDTRDDAKLLPGDVIFIPPVGPTVSVDGEVRRPAIYETRSETSVADVVQLAGGLTPEADRAKVALSRTDESEHRVVLEVDLGSRAKGQAVQNGDLLRVARLNPTLDSGVTVQGYAYDTGVFSFHNGMRLTDVIRSADELKPDADIHYLLIRRESPLDHRVSVLSADLEAALRAPGSAADVPLMARDRITAFDRQSSRERVIKPLLETLKLQANITNPTQIVRIDGRANVPGEYPLETGMKVRDLIRAGGSLSDSAYGAVAELTRYQVVNGESRNTVLIKIDLNAALHGDPAANIALEPFDTLSIKEVQSWDEQEQVTLKGEVRFPGKYLIKRGETLKSVMLRAGGLTDLAFVDGSVFTRKELKVREQKQLDMLADRMQTDIAFVALEGSVSNQQGAGTALTVGQSLMSQVRAAKAVGRLVINLKQTLGAPIGSESDVILRDGDQLLVPKYEQEVTVIGEVQSATSHLYRPELSRDDYISMSGGATRRADTGRIYIVQANGSVLSNESARWFRGNSAPIKPGDTIVVPLNAEHMPPLPLWQAVTQILYNVAIASLAVREF